MDAFAVSIASGVTLKCFNTKLALRVALWSIRIPKTRSTLLLDEPFRNLNRTAQPRAAKMIKELTKFKHKTKNGTL